MGALRLRALPRETTRRCGRAHVLEVFQQMLGARFTALVRTSVAKVKAEEEGIVADLFSEMQERGLAPNEVTYSAAISACDEKGQWELALDLIILYIIIVYDISVLVSCLY